MSAGTSTTPRLSLSFLVPAPLARAFQHRQGAYSPRDDHCLCHLEESRCHREPCQQAARRSALQIVRQHPGISGPFLTQSQRGGVLHVGAHASLEDAEAVSALLQASYPSLMALGYEPVLFARALPLLTKANPALLSSGTWYVVELPGAVGTLVGCGGWARQRPDAPNEPVDTVLGHLRHFATHPKWTRRGMGRALFERCVAMPVSLECALSSATQVLWQRLFTERLASGRSSPWR